MSDDDDESIAGQASIKASLHSMRSFDVDRSQLVCSGYMSKKARGRRMVGKLFDNIRKRWFELRCDPTGDGGVPSYAVMYYKSEEDKKPKGEVLVRFKILGRMPLVPHAMTLASPPNTPITRVAPSPPSTPRARASSSRLSTPYSRTRTTCAS